MHFLTVFELMSDSLTVIQVEPHQCPSHQSILLIQGPIHEIFTKKYRELAILKNSGFFESAILKFFFCFSPMKISQSLLVSRWVEILMITLVSSQKQPSPNIFGRKCTQYILTYYIRVICMSNHGLLNRWTSHWVVQRGQIYDLVAGTRDPNYTPGPCFGP